jgi:hypothetical protein
VTAKASPKKATAAPAKQKAAAQPEKASPKKVRTDWEAVERAYRVGKLTLREIAELHSATAGRICQVAKERGWMRGDLKTVVNAATQSLLVAELVDGEVHKVKQGLNESVLAAAELNSQVIQRHRARVKRAVDVAMRMLDELDSTTLKTDELQALFTKVTADIGGPALQVAQQKFRDLMRLHARIGSSQKLMAALKDAQALEAQAYGNLYEVKKNEAGELELLTDDQMNARIKELQAKLAL